MPRHITVTDATLAELTELTDGSETVLHSHAGGSLPDQTGNSGKYLTTDGSDASWATVASGGLTHPQVLARGLGV